MRRGVPDSSLPRRHSVCRRTIFRSSTWIVYSTGVQSSALPASRGDSVRGAALRRSHPAHAVRPGVDRGVMCPARAAAPVAAGRQPTVLRRRARRPHLGRLDTDVLVVGAGPTGLMLANQLVRRGVRVMIVDRHAGPSLQTRALGVQARTMEIYAKLGIVDRALELGKIGNGANLWAQGRKMARVPLGEAGKFVTPYPYILILGQDDNERIMGDKLRELGVSVQWSTELIGLTQEPDKVTATLKLADGTSRKI